MRSINLLLLPQWLICQNLSNTLSKPSREGQQPFYPELSAIGSQRLLLKLHEQQVLFEQYILMDQDSNTINMILFIKSTDKLIHCPQDTQLVSTDPFQGTRYIGLKPLCWRRLRRCPVHAHILQSNDDKEYICYYPYQGGPSNSYSARSPSPWFYFQPSNHSIVSKFTAHFLRRRDIFIMVERISSKGLRDARTFGGCANFIPATG